MYNLSQNTTKSVILDPMSWGKLSLSPSICCIVKRCSIHYISHLNLNNQNIEGKYILGIGHILVPSHSNFPLKTSRQILHANMKTVPAFSNWNIIGMHHCKKYFNKSLTIIKMISTNIVKDLIIKKTKINSLLKI